MPGIPDHPVIRNMEATGYPDGKEPEYPHCPVCSEECETIYREADGSCLGCNCCIQSVDAWEADECFPEKE